MFISLNWLKDFVTLPKNISPRELADRLTRQTMEIESVRGQAEFFDRVAIGKILSVAKHPQADRLRIAVLDLGREKLSIVCGADNIKTGQMVPVALPGALLPNGLKIEKTQIRGEWSDGMLCAADELGLGDFYSGVMTLTEKAKVGQALADYLGLDDFILEVDNKSITHRSDLWSHYGLSREIAALFDLPLKKPAWADDLPAPVAAPDSLPVTVHEPALCARYQALVLSGVRVEESPDWLKKRLVAAGLKPINNIVDVTNYTMLETGQPLHAFDRDKINRLDVRLSKNEERIALLNGEQKSLPGGLLLIADADRPLAVAGVMGGADSEITPATVRIALEAANFDFLTIRKSQQSLGLRTEASIRFEKFLPPELCSFGLSRAFNLLKKICPGLRVEGGLIDARSENSPRPAIKVKIDWLNRRIGLAIKKEKAVAYLVRLGFQVEDQGDELLITAPFWRTAKEISRPEDIMEEIARLHGFDQLPLTLPAVRLSAPDQDKNLLFAQEARKILVYNGALSEVLNYSFVDEKFLAKLNLSTQDQVALANPISAQQTLLRSALAPGLIANIIANQARYDETGFFEIGLIFQKLPGVWPVGDQDGAFLPHQEKRLGLALAGADGPVVFRRLKTILTALAAAYYLPLEFEKTDIFPGWTEKNLCAALVIAGRPIGLAALISQPVAKRVGLKKSAGFAEIRLAELVELAAGRQAHYQPETKFPPIKRDLALLVDKNISYLDIKNTILAFSPLIRKIELFDVFAGDQVGPKKKSLAFHFVYQAERTLQAEEINQLQKELMKNLAEKFGAALRDF